MFSLIDYVLEWFFIYICGLRFCSIEMKTKLKNILRSVSKVLLWTAGIWSVLLLVLQIVLSTQVPTRLINRYAPEFFDGTIEFENVSASMIRHFPGLSLSFENLKVTYDVDSLDLRLKARMKRFEADANILPFLFGNIKVPDLEIDSMAVVGRMGADTILFGLDMFHIHGRGRNMKVHAEAKTFLATRSFGRMMIPINLDGKARILRDSVPAFAVKDMKLDIASVPMTADAGIRLYSDRTGIKGKVGINGCKINDITEGYIINIIPEVADLNTDARVYLTATLDGCYDHATGALPSVNVSLEIPEAGVCWKGIDENLTIALKADGGTDSHGRINASVSRLMAETKGLGLNLSGSAEDLLGVDPALSLNGTLGIDLDSLSSFIPDTLGLEAHGQMNAELKGQARLSQLSIYNFSAANLTGHMHGKGISVSMPSDTLEVNISSMNFTLGPEEKTSRMDSTRKFRLIGIGGSIDTVNVTYGSSLSLNGNGIAISAKNADMSEQTTDSAQITPFSGKVSARNLSLKDGAGSSVRLVETSNRFSIFPKKGHSTVPVLSLSSSNDKIMLRTAANRLILTDADMRASAAMNTVERRHRAKAFMDSLALRYPDVPRDSLFSHLKTRMAKAEVPDWLQDEDFRKQDFDLRLDESMAKYFREWDIKGDIKVRTGIAMTPYLPLRNILRGMECSFTNDKVSIDSLKFMSGKSSLGAKGALTGLKRTLLGRGTLKLDLDINSKGMDANELLTALAKGSEYNPELAGDMSEASDAEFLQMVVTEDSTKLEEVPSLIVIPANINADIALNAENIIYSDLDISQMTANMKMARRCLQITDTKAVSNMGEISFEGFYSTRTKKDLNTGFSLNFKDITAEKVISLIPAADTLLPMIKSFSGLLNCEIAGTASLDTNMNIVMPSVNGILRISGQNLEIKDNEMFRSLAKLLLFKNKKTGHIDNMIVEGVLKDNTLEIFPFILKMDRYTLAMSGIQNMDMSFKYHVSVIKSPLLFKLGMDLYGQDFDNMKFKLGKAKYKSVNVPAFSSVVEDTKINLLHSIRDIFSKGVEAAVKENMQQKAIEAHKREIGYVKAVDQELESLSAEEQKQMEEEEAASAEESTETGQGNEDKK